MVKVMGPRTFAILENCVSLYHLLVDNVKSKARPKARLNLASLLPGVFWLFCLAPPGGMLE
jgi:hypothetical protein